MLNRGRQVCRPSDRSAAAHCCDHQKPGRDWHRNHVACSGIASAVSEQRYIIMIAGGVSRPGRLLLQFNVDGCRPMAAVHWLSDCTGAHSLATDTSESCMRRPLQRMPSIFSLQSDRARVCRLQARAAIAIEALTGSWVCAALSEFGALNNTVTRAVIPLLNLHATCKTKCWAGGQNQEFQSTFSTRRSRCPTSATSHQASCLTRVDLEPLTKLAHVRRVSSSQYIGLARVSPAGNPATFKPSHGPGALLARAATGWRFHVHFGPPMIHRA